MKIVMIASSYYPARGGVETHTEAVANELRKLGHRVTILVRYAKRPARVLHHGITVYRLPQTRVGFRAWALRHRRLLAETDVFHSHDHYLATLKRLFPQKRFVHTFHGYEGYPVAQAAIQARQAINTAVDASVAVGKFIEKWYGTKCDLITYGGIEPIKIQAAPIKWDLIYFGRLEPDTGIANYLEAFGRLLEANSDLRILIVGNGSAQSAVNELATQHAGRVTTMPMQDHQSLLDLLNASRIACVSGYLAILEAAYLGKLVMATYDTPIKKDYLACHPLAKDLVVGASGKELADLIAPELKHTQLQGERAKSMQRWATQQTWQALAEQYVNLYQANVV